MYYCAHTAFINERYSSAFGFELLTAVTIKIFWDVTPCNLVVVHLCFGGTYCPHYHGPRYDFLAALLASTFSFQPHNPAPRPYFSPDPSTPSITHLRPIFSPLQFAQAAHFRATFLYQIASCCWLRLVLTEFYM
jgi:hypothetical protein